MRSIQQFIREEVLRPKLQKAGVLVVYDPERHYRNLCCEMANDKCAVVDALVDFCKRNRQANSFARISASVFPSQSGLHAAG